jgi:enediyne biosynthesis protein E4
VHLRRVVRLRGPVLFLAGAAAVFAGAGRREGVPRFTNVTSVSGIRFVNICGEADRKDYIFEAKGGGVGALDFDGDGWMDIVFAQGSTMARFRSGDNPTPVLYRNRGDGTFEDVTVAAGLSHRGWGMGVSAADYDNDGWTDLYLTYLGPDVLYRNNGDGTFTDVTAKAGIVAPGWSASAAFGDFDRDGHLDLYVACYLDVGPDKLPPDVAGGACNYLGKPVLCGPRGLAGARDYFFHNNGDGTFSERSDESGAADKDRYFGLGVVAADVDNDRDLDIYVANDSTPKLLFVNRGDGRFDERGIVSGLAFDGDGNEQAGMGVDLADYDNDGWLDAYSTHFAHDYNTLYHNTGKGLFEDVTRVANARTQEQSLVSWGTRFVDVDLDGWKDIVYTSGHVYPFLRAPIGSETYEQRALTLYLNNGDGSFAYASESAGPDALKGIVGRGAAFADFDNDGDVDVVIACLNAPPVLFRSDRNDHNHWIMFRTVGRASNRDGIGARLTVQTGGLSQVWEIKRTVGIYACSDPRAHFGLGAATKADLVRIDWPSGKSQEIRDVPADAHYLLEEERGLSRERIRGRES